MLSADTRSRSPEQRVLDEERALRRRARLWLAARVALTVAVLGFFGWFLRKLDLPTVWADLRAARLPLVGAAVALNFLHLGFRAARLGVLLAPSKRVSLPSLYRYTLAMCAASNLLPARAGEVLRVWLLHARDRVPAPTAVAASLVEKGFDLLALLLLAAPIPLLLPALPHWVQTSIALLAAVGLAAVVAAIVISRLGRGKPGGFLDRFAQGAQVARRPGLAALAVALSIAAWLTDAAEVLLVLWAVGVNIPLAGPLLVLLTLNLALAMPSTPAQVGAFEMGAVVALRLLGVPEAAALAFAVIYHVMQVVPTTLLGIPDLRLAMAERKRG